jgi:hypothetical protein
MGNQNLCPAVAGNCCSDARGLFVLEFVAMYVQHMFYGCDLQHRDILDRAQATVTVLEDSNTECFQYDDDINSFQLADITSREIGMEALKACEETLDCSAALSKRCV